MFVFRGLATFSSSFIGNVEDERNFKISVEMRSYLIGEPVESYQRVIFSLPIITVLMSSLACIIAYSIGVNEGKIDQLPFLPYISDTGDLKPQSSVFTLFMGLSCFFTFAIILVRYYQVKYFKSYRVKCYKANEASFYSGTIFVFGKLIVASFQLSSNIVIHFLGAGMYFLGASIFAVLQLYITYHNQYKESCLYLMYIRGVCCTGMIISMVVVGIFVIPALSIHNRDGENVAQGAEWTIAIFKSIFMLTFLHDFWKVQMKVLFSFQQTEQEEQISQQHEIGVNNPSMYVTE